MKDEDIELTREHPEAEVKHIVRGIVRRGLKPQAGCGRQKPRSGGNMKKAYDFSKAKRGAVVPPTGKTRITIYLDDEIVQEFKKQAEKTGKGYQTLINEVLNAYLEKKEKPLTADLVRKIVREELAASS